MNHQTFKERLEEILDWARFEQEWIATEVKDHDPKTEHEKTCGVCVKMRVLNEQATQSLITLFEDYTKSIVGEEELVSSADLLHTIGLDTDEGFRKCNCGASGYSDVPPRIERNNFRQTINQISKNILRGENKYE